MKLEKLSILGTYKILNEMHLDNRGIFFEWFNSESFFDLSLDFPVAQANFSTSTKSVIRGIHYSLAKEGQSKIVMCSSGQINDVLVDLRYNSPTFMKTENINLNPESGTAIYIPAGVGHGFSVLSESASLTYLLSSRYSPSDEHTIQPLDKNMAIDWRLSREEQPILSVRDETAMTLAGAKSKKLLPKL